MTQAPFTAKRNAPQVAKRFRDAASVGKQIQAIVALNTATHNEHTVLTAAWKDTRLALGERSAPVAYQAQYLSAGIKPGPSEAIIEHLPFCSDPPLPARDRAVNWGWLYLHRLAPFYSGAA